MAAELDRRKKEILKAIIREHILTAEPIGSRTLAKNYDLGVSSATIRNEMSDLEELGYLEQPYTSAGRIPSDKGYRFYVDYLMELESLSGLEYQKLLSNFNYEKQGIQTIMSGMAKMLSRLTRYTAMISEPQLKKSKIRQVQLLNVTNNSLLIVLITDTGIVHNKIVKLNQELTSKHIRYLNHFLSAHLNNRDLNSITEEYMKELEKELIKRIDLSLGLFKLVYKEVQKIAKPADMKIYLGGTSYILEQPEFNDLKKLKQVLNLLDHEEILRELLQNIPNNGLKVKIGQENELEEIQNCSIVFASYHIGDKAIGKMGVIGPTRMEYPRVIPTVNYVADMLGKISSKLSG